MTAASSTSGQLVIAAVDSPVERFVGFGEPAPSARRLRRRSSALIAQRMAQPRPVEALVAVRRVVDERNVLVEREPRQVHVPPAEQRAQNLAVAGADRRQAADAAAAVEPHDHRFELIVGMVRGDDEVDSLFAAPAVEQIMAPFAPRPAASTRLDYPASASRGEYVRARRNATMRACPAEPLRNP